ncbi:hypothetical protein AQZ59_00063 [Trueperella bernardiae]|uniref:DUF4439 domain-containing protein n=1 Tax=Trueperella bernardiae TaxID=59561 RepID=A0A0W1KL81_9ACTO|nr:hypothetical protein [Trueperella bernardiae]KTF04763.1 hypothetical protein AQZ59_00063 [Trueperella bernardiae]
MAHRQGSTLAFIGTLLLGIALFALVMVVMGAHLDRDVSPAPASDAEVERQMLAARATAISDDPAFADVAAHWAEALGGVWVPWPDGAPEGYTNPVEPYVAGSDTHAELLELSRAALDSSLGPIATSVGISALTLGATDADQCGEYELSDLARSLNSGVSVANIETARQWLEWHAATIPAGQRDAELARIDELTDLLDAQLASGAPDDRPVIAPEPEGPYVEDAFNLLIDQLAFSATQADPAGKQAIASFVCHMAKTPDAPLIEALPGIEFANAEG